MQNDSNLFWKFLCERRNFHWHRKALMQTRLYVALLTTCTYILNCTSRPHVDASTDTANDAMDGIDQQEENEEAGTDNIDQTTIAEEQDQDKGVDDEDDLGGNLGELKFVYPLASSLRATPAAFAALRQENNRRPRQNSFSAMGA